MDLKKLFSQKYHIKTKCENCKSTVQVSIPRGVPVQEALETNNAKCPECGCSVVNNSTGEVEEYKGLRGKPVRKTNDRVGRDYEINKLRPL